MEWKDTAIVLNVHSYNDTLLIVSCLASKYGLCSGTVRNTKSGRNVVAVGNIISVSWRGRLESHLGQFNIASHESIYPFIYDNQEKMIAMISLCSIFHRSLAHKEPQKNLYNYLEDFLYAVKYDEKTWLKRLLFIELELLSHIGFGLDLDKCAISGDRDNLCYLSPKTGRALSREVGEQHKTKLFKLPEVFHDFDMDVSVEEMFYALKITKHFLEKNLEIPETRNKLEQILQKRISCLQL